MTYLVQKLVIFIRKQLLSSKLFHLLLAGLLSNWRASIFNRSIVRLYVNSGNNPPAVTLSLISLRGI